MPEQFDFVSIKKKANVHFNGTSISHILVLKDGTKKTVGVILPSEQPLTFQTYIAERIEIISGQCQVQIGNGSEIRIYSSGEWFVIPANSQFKIQSTEIVDYICHFD
ncbi:pyrimidine/purine nucleoside phosphorylase [Acinetobacter haemolyticus]|uniref:pyrimidine/purine nucleoside phosphorylase n=1 Tax=Acinetobacter haemolyticus TaxID=29430 RepID=UPI0021CD685D|nr:pyrimidine/purine nucleoside phosphorylase [Acinetobacter haemolyticus]MCU4379614.1 pyrimidine/purine nucleoside phosphorylase [Acinetobacter haemolyticus]